MEEHIEALRKIQEALSGLEEEKARQVLRWAAEYYGVSTPAAVPPAGGSQTGGLGRSSVEAEGNSREVEFEDVGDLFDAANPGTDSEKALVVGYWFQEFEGRDQLEAQQTNNELKNLGYRVKNITSAFTDLMNRQPRLVRQVSKSGSARQARKKYKITREGVRKVQAMISGDSQNGE